MGCGGLEGILKRQYALSGGHLAGRILILRVCSACHPGLGLQTSKRACRRRELTNPVLGAVAGRIAGTGGVTGTGQCPVRTCLGRRRADRSGRRGVTGHPEGAEREAGAAAVRFSAHAGRARICGKLVGARDRPRGTRVFAENRWARWIGHRVRERHIRCAHPVSPEGGWRRNIATYAAGRPIPRAHDFRVPKRRRLSRSCPARNGALSGEEGKKMQKGKEREEETEGAEESAAGPRKCGGNMVCVPGPLPGLHPKTAADAVTHFSQLHFLTQGFGLGPGSSPESCD